LSRNQLVDVDEVIDLTRWLLSTPEKHLFVLLVLLLEDEETAESIESEKIQEIDEIHSPHRVCNPETSNL
jgi:hypothetical protein